MINEAVIHQLQGDHVIASLVEIEEWLDLTNANGEIVDTKVINRRHEARIVFLTTDDEIVQDLPDNEADALTAFHAVFSSYEEINGIEPDPQPAIPAPVVNPYASNPLFGRF